MKKLITMYLLFFALITANYAQLHTITNSGDAFTPADITISLGDSVRINVGDFHPVVQVSEATWNTNGTTALAGGFNFPGGNGTVVPESTGIIYFVCSSHVGVGMKGVIRVEGQPASIDDNAGNDLRLFPNPLTSDQLQIRMNGLVSDDLSIKIFEITGRQVTGFDRTYDNSSNTVAIVFNDIKRGIYLIEVNGSGINTIEKLIVP